MTDSGRSKDVFFLVLIILLSAVFYTSRLGFYSDDWAFLGAFATSADQSLPGLLNTFGPDMRMRPAHAIYLAGLYYVFGTAPLGYHLVIVLILCLLAIAIYTCVRELTGQRLLTLGFALVYLTLPHYSADRFWVAASHSNVSIMLYFVSLQADLRYLKLGSGRRRWLLLGAASLLLSLLTYEVILPFFLLNPLLILLCHSTHQPAFTQGEVQRAEGMVRLSRAALLVLFARNAVLIIIIAAFKALTATRLKVKEGLTEYVASLLKTTLSINYTNLDYGLNLKQAIITNYIDFLVGAPFILGKILFLYPSKSGIALGVMVGLIAGAYNYHLLRSGQADLLAPAWGRRLIIIGVLLFFSGYGVFLTNKNVQFTLTGIGNRTAIAAALGVAVSLVGASAWVSSVGSTQKSRQVCYSLAIAFFVAYGTMLMNTLSLFWADAYVQEKEILSRLRQDMSTVNAGDTILLDGVCLYEGPAVLFETDWDTRGALRTIYGVHELNGDVVKPTLKVKPEGIALSLYGSERLYLYSERLTIYNYNERKSYQMGSYDHAVGYLAGHKPGELRKCPTGYEGLGASVF